MSKGNVSCISAVRLFNERDKEADVKTHTSKSICLAPNVLWCDCSEHGELKAAAFWHLVTVSQSSMDSLSNRLGWLSMTHSHMHRSSDPRPYPYVIGMPVNTEDYSYQLSAKCRLAGMLKLISVCENACVSALGPVSVTAALPLNRVAPGFW